MLFLKYIYVCQNRPIEVSTVPFPKQVLNVIEQTWKAASPKNFIFLLSLKRLLKHIEQGAATQTRVETSSQARKPTDPTPPEVSLYLFVLVMRVFCLFFCFFVVRRLNRRSSMNIISSTRHFEVFLNSHSFFENLIEKFTLKISISIVNYSRGTTSLI